MAAMTVLVSHLSEMRLTEGFLWQVGQFLPGTDAVIVFFVLSGFVIAYVTETREKSAGDYIISRTTRIYSVSLPALLITFALHTIGSAVRPDFYPSYSNDAMYGSILQFFCGLTFTSELWWLHVPIFSNVPYWSLSYEVWYYVIFGAAVFAPPVWRWVAILVLLAFLGPTIVTALPIWLLGVVLWRVVGRFRPSPWLSASLWVGSLLIWAT
jgi:peptidoglycan/LPS O-acetylase OafA/YrhL